MGTNKGTFWFSLKVQRPLFFDPKAETEELPANEEATQALKASRSVTGFYEDVNAILECPLIPCSLTKV